MLLRTNPTRWGLGLVLAALVACPFRATAADPYELNVIIPMTGGGTFLGQAERDALLALEASVNKTGGISGRPLHFAIADDQSNPSLAVQLTNGLLAKKVPVILGSALTAMCNAQTPLITETGPLMYCFSGGYHPGTNPYLYGGSVNSRDFIAGGLRYLRLKNWRRIALMTSIDSSGQDGEHAVDDLMTLSENKALTLVAREPRMPSSSQSAERRPPLRAADRGEERDAKRATSQTTDRDGQGRARCFPRQRENLSRRD